MKGRFLGPSNEVANERIKLGTARWFGSLPRTEGKTVKTWGGSTGHRALHGAGNENERNQAEQAT
jgi:hypothetical protein